MSSILLKRNLPHPLWVEHLPLSYEVVRAGFLTGPDRARGPVFDPVAGPVPLTARMWPVNHLTVSPTAEIEKKYTNTNIATLPCDIFFCFLIFWNTFFVQWADQRLKVSSRQYAILSNICVYRSCSLREFYWDGLSKHCTRQETPTAVTKTVYIKLSSYFSWILDESGRFIFLLLLLEGHWKESRVMHVERY